VLAKERGIKIKESKELNIRDYTSLIVAKILTDKGEIKVAATMFNESNPRIVKINGMGVDFDPRGGIIVIINEDKPGVVGNVGKVLGDNGVNIAGMNLARKDVGAQALTIIEVDDKVSPEIINKIIQIGGIKTAQYIDLERE
jgi:D-3-phosphoglycerate dehydrogenase